MYFSVIHACIYYVQAVPVEVKREHKSSLTLQFQTVICLYVGAWN